MKKTVQQIPFLRPVIAIIAGILIATVVTIPLKLLLLAILCLLLVLILFHRNFTFSFSFYFGFGLHVLFLLIGIAVFEYNNKKPVFYEKGIFTATVLEQPQQKTKSLKSVLEITAVKTGDSAFNTNEKILAYFSKENNSERLKAGDIINFTATPKPITNFGTPYEFDYKKYLDRKKIYRTVFLSTQNWKPARNVSANSIKIKAEQFREQLLKIYREQKFEKNELEILSALTLGYKRSLDPETKRIFSAAGAMHVLAVSGLHVGIVLWVITLLFGFLRKLKWGKLFFVIISIGLLWVFAFVTGLSPSVMRATTMFSIFIVGENIRRKSNSYNSLTASAFFLLLINPNNLFDIGFQLSFAAVFGIIYLQPKFSQLLQIKNKIGRFFWTLLTVSVAAQIATLPISLYYFNQFSTFFFITNIIIIPAVMALIPLGIALLVFSKTVFLSSIITTIIQFIIQWSYKFLVGIEQLPFSVLNGSIRPIQLFFIVGTLLALLLFLQWHRPHYLKAALSFLLLLLVSSVILNSIQSHKTEVICYKNSTPPIIQLIKGRNDMIITNCRKSDFGLISQRTKTVCNRLKLKSPSVITLSDTIKGRYLFSKNGIILFEGKTILFNIDTSELIQNISPDFIVNSKQY